ncbi:MAG: hypothetical protein IT318_25885 [Anaerolineales bacterium]|nr:hypothetical protein [Anaerolineales bacterium]
MFFGISNGAQQFGFISDTIGVHTSRTLMLAELRLLLAACPPAASFDQYQAAILDDNVLLKRTVSTRRESVRRLRELYALDPSVLLFRALRDLWPDDSEAQPLLALLCALARDPTLRGTTELILSVPAGEIVTPQMISAAAGQSFPERFNAMTLANIGRHAASTWQQSGHLQGRAKKVRSQAASQPASVAFALLLGFLGGGRGDGLFQTVWARLLDAPEHRLRSQAAVAAHRGYLEYRHAGGVTEISFHYLLRDIRQPGLD